MTTRNRFHVALLFAFGSLLGPSLAHAQAFDAVRLYGAAPGQDGGSIAAVVLAGTQYQGSNERRTLVLPVLDYQWANGWFAGVSNGVGYNFSSSAQLQYGLRLTAALDRKENRSNALRGLGDVDAKAEGGAFFNVLSSDGYFFSSSVRYGSGTDSKGLLLDLGAGYATSLAPQWHLGVGAAVTVANAAYLQSYFGVTAAQAAGNGYAACSAMGRAAR
jgi:outer membrane scaffolding protein for murein synthesis (MipA/OmpV family)